MGFLESPMARRMPEPILYSMEASAPPNMIRQ